MIDPSDLNLSTLPSVPMEMRSQLPATSGIYFAIDSLDRVQYIGMAANLKNRWNSHHRYGYLRRAKSVRIAYLHVSDPAFLPEIESAMIRYFDPPLNGLGSWGKPVRNQSRAESVRSGITVRRIVKQEVDIPGLGEQIKRAREADSRSLTKLANLVGVSRNYWYQLESESVMGGMAEETLRRIEEVLGVDFGVQFDE